MQLHSIELKNVIVCFPITFIFAFIFCSCVCLQGLHRKNVSKITQCFIMVQCVLTWHV